MELYVLKMYFLSYMFSCQMLNQFLDPLCTPDSLKLQLQQF